MAMGRTEPDAGIEGQAPASISSTRDSAAARGDGRGEGSRYRIWRSTRQCSDWTHGSLAMGNEKGARLVSCGASAAGLMML